MLARHFGARTNPPVMVDDSMEISSEYGHQGGDDEIDIDIDFGTAPADEDYAIEDAASHTGFADGLQPQASQAVGNDDLMIDEDHPSYPMGDEDLVLDDDDHKMEQEAASMSFAMGGDSSHFVVDEDIDTVQGPEIPSTEGGIMWDEPELPKSTVDENDLLGDSEQTLQQDEGYIEQLEYDDKHGEQEIEEPAKLPSEHASRMSTPQNGSPRSGTAQEPRSPAASVPGAGPVSPEHISKDFAPLPSPHSVTGGTDKTTKFVAANNVSSFTAAPEINVVYQSSEYTLFSKTESDDPDSFFLSDTSILEKPLGDFFHAMRDVIQDDLGDEEELCMSVEDLGLELEENSISAQAATLGQIISLRDTVLRNDGVESHRPLYLSLGTRVNFSKRFANLTAGAAEGKGLSDLVSWDDGSEGVDESEVVDESTHGNEANLKSDTNGELLHHETADGFVVERNHASPSHPASVHDKQKEAEHIENTEEEPQVGSESVATHPHSESTGLTVSKPSEFSNPAENESTNEGYGENEDDLIDYSDEEEQDSETKSQGAATFQTDETRTQDGNSDDLLTPCILPNTCFCSACNDLLIAEYDAINEHLRRRSLTRAAGESILEEPGHHLHVDGETEQPPQADEEAAVNDEDNGADEFDAESENLTAEDILGSTEHVDHGDELAVNDELERDQNQGQDPSTGLPLGQDEYFDENGLQYHEETELDTENADLPGQELTDFNDFFEESNIPADTLEFGDTAESSVTVSADDQNQGEKDLGEYNLDDSKADGERHALENATSNGANTAPEDEIDYEDDEENNGPASNGVSAPLPTANDPLATNGKRQRSDAEADDTSRGKEAKRPRSRS